ncbi:hypothetical protein M422DRAFT_258539 [Sphaerobolus stellatus SS14]|uniref:Uncharacterized protein n=1 Tax=Sphaerobolus stellatus (strain SS14) TaxID=990650 RepID=A0A0C9UUX8_SPHS4|nr:hypothetical protein M422DRAFT_258539 [Sphaerobolus stellatus SS14]
MSGSTESHSKRSRNAADLLSRFREKQAQRDEKHVKLDIEKADNRQLRSELDDLDEKIQELEVRILSLQPKTPAGDPALAAASTTDISSSDVSPHPLSSPGDRTYSRKSSRKLYENPSFQNRVMVPDQRPDYWSLYMWNALKEWHTNPMSVPNALRDDRDGYFLEEDIDVAAWISKVASDISCPAFMEQMKAVFGSRDNFDTAFSGFATNLLKPDHEATMWITDSSTPLRIDTHIVKGRPPKSQDSKPEKLPTGPDFLALVLEHCALTRAQIYGRIIPYMIRHEAKWPCSRAGIERAAYMHLTLRPPAPHKGKRPVTGSLQSRLSVHAPTPVRTGESSSQRLDADLDKYNQVHEPVLPYEEEPPRGEPEVGDTAPPAAGANNTLPDESNMEVDSELDDLYS